MSAEDKFSEIVEKLKSEITKAAADAVYEIHGGIVPYVNDDTEFNAIYRAKDIIRDVMHGNFDVVDNKIKCGFFSIELTSGCHDRLVDALASRCADKAKDLKIERLERQIKEMTSQQLGY